MIVQCWLSVLLISRLPLIGSPEAAGGEVGVVVVEDFGGRGAVVVAVDDRRVVAAVGQVEEVELEDVRVRDAELVLDQLLELLQGRRR